MNLGLDNITTIEELPELQGVLNVALESIELCAESDKITHTINTLEMGLSNLISIKDTIEAYGITESVKFMIGKEALVFDTEFTDENKDNVLEAVTVSIESLGKKIWALIKKLFAYLKESMYRMIVSVERVLKHAAKYEKVFKQMEKDGIMTNELKFKDGTVGFSIPKFDLLDNKKTFNPNAFKIRFAEYDTLVAKVVKKIESGEWTNTNTELSDLADDTWLNEITEIFIMFTDSKSRKDSRTKYLIKGGTDTTETIEKAKLIFKEIRILYGDLKTKSKAIKHYDLKNASKKGYIEIIDPNEIPPVEAINRCIKAQNIFYRALYSMAKGYIDVFNAVELPNKYIAMAKKLKIYNKLNPFEVAEKF